MIHIQCPGKVLDSKKEKWFLAGGITGCSDWQSEILSYLKDLDFIAINPRRKFFDINKKDIEEEQIRWEFDALKKSDAVSFWFPSETLCPITLYELGKISMTKKKILIGVHPDYKRINDIKIQTKLLRPEIKIVDSLKDLSKQIIGDLSK